MPSTGPSSAFLGNSSGEAVAVVVLGMHRSGTSALTRVLSLLGCDLPANLMPAAAANQAGHWEAEPLRLFNDALMESAGSAWSDWTPFNSDWYASPVVGSFRQRAEELIAQEFGDSSLFVMKDPRICRLFPFWRQVLQARGARIAVVVPVRNPLEVADSLTRRDRMERNVGLLLWLRYVLDAERSSRGQKRSFTRYEDLLGDWSGVLERVGGELGVVWPRRSLHSLEQTSTFLDPQLRHNYYHPSDVSARAGIPSWVTEVFAILDRWAREGESAADYALLDQLAKAFDEATPILFSLARAAESHRQSVARLEHDMQALRAIADQREIDIGTLHGRIAEIQAVIDPLDNSLGEMSEALAEKELEQGERIAQIGALRDAVAAAAQREADVEARLSEAATREEALQASLRDALDQRAEVELRCQFADERVVALERAVSEGAACIQEARGRMAELESQVAQRRAEADEARAALEQLELELAAGRDQAVAFGAEWDRRLRESESWVFRLAADRAGLERDNRQLVSRIAVMERELKGQRMQNVRLSAALDVQQRLQAESEARDAGLLAERDAALAMLHEVEREAQRHAADADARMTSLAEESVAAAARLEAALTSHAEECADKARALQAAAARAHEMEVRIADLEQQLTRFAATESLLDDRQEALRAAEHGASEARALRQAGVAANVVARDALDWLVEVQQVLARAPRWWDLMPRDWRRRQDIRRLRLSGLFDDRAYLALNPDVASSGVDPLRHYMRFGIRENRRRE